MGRRPIGIVDQIHRPLPRRTSAAENPSFNSRFIFNRSRQSYSVRNADDILASDTPTVFYFWQRPLMTAWIALVTLLVASIVGLLVVVFFEVPFLGVVSFMRKVIPSFTQPLLVLLVF